MNNYDYPAGADSCDAPWNEEENEEKTFDVTVSISLAKRMQLGTDDYFTDVDTNGDYPVALHTVYAGHDWETDYENECYTIPEMLEELKRYIESELPMSTGSRRIRLQGMLKDCQGWTKEEFYAEED